MAKLSPLFESSVTFLMSNHVSVSFAPATSEFIVDLSLFEIVNVKQNLMGKFHRCTWLKFGLLASIASFVLLAGAAGWQISRVSVATDRMEEMTQLLALADNWLGDVRQAEAALRSSDLVLEAAGARIDAEKHFFAHVRDEGTRTRAEQVREIRQIWANRREQAQTLSADGGLDAAQRSVATLTASYIHAAQALVNGLLNDLLASGKEIKGRFVKLYLIVAGLLLSVMSFAALLGWQVLRNGASRRRRESEWLEESQRGQLTSQEEIGQLLKGLSTIHE
jgi:hypothetical protein